jgi:uncharacterized protein GlcG (DUF336 family)
MEATMKRFILAAALTLAVALPACAEEGKEGIVTYKSLAPDIAFDLARAALNKCRKDGFQVAVVVVDRFGLPLAVVRDRFANSLALRVAEGKAWTSTTFARDTGALLKDNVISPALSLQPKVTAQVGGLVIEAGGSLLGGVGVSGAPGGDKDEACARAGLESVRDKLEF